MSSQPNRGGRDDELLFSLARPDPVSSLIFVRLKMNTKQLLAAIALITVASSVLAEAPYPPEVPFISTKTRAEVKEDLAQARAQGLMTVSDADYPQLPAFVSTKTREQVRAEAVEASKKRDENNLYKGR